ncbi:helix-turn-helix domain-containing protein [Brucella anthropi]|uniref:helix-turn-helix domain-containing protein n=1 Tax=Brucella anthropi TaxID=529 RepID=UPI002362B170|nr:helix-turn-helix domain-containing protein [Brucella anthropi]
MARPESEPKTPLARRLREVRAHFEAEDRGEFAQLLGFAKSSLANYERGERTPDAAVLLAYRDKLGVNLNWLVSGEGQAFSDPNSVANLKSDVPTSSPDENGIGKRVLEVRDRLGLSQRDAAHRLGVSLRSWQGMERGENIPNGETLLKFQSLGFNAGWILTGLGSPNLEQPTCLDAAHIKPARINEEVLDNLVILSHDEHKAAGITLRPDDNFREATKLYNELLAVVHDPNDEEELSAAIPIVKVRFRKRLSEAVENPGTGKRSAS